MKVEILGEFFRMVSKKYPTGSSSKTQMLAGDALAYVKMHEHKMRCRDLKDEVLRGPAAHPGIRPPKLRLAGLAMN